MLREQNQVGDSDCGVPICFFAGQFFMTMTTEARRSRNPNSKFPSRGVSTFFVLQVQA